MQYLKHFQTKQLPILERFALLISVTVIWAYAHLLTASGAYKHRPELTQTHCRTDRANLISSAPWLVVVFPNISKVTISNVFRHIPTSMGFSLFSRSFFFSTTGFQYYLYCVSVRATCMRFSLFFVPEVCNCFSSL